jgi:hypothetical protein
MSPTPTLNIYLFEDPISTVTIISTYCLKDVRPKTCIMVLMNLKEETSLQILSLSLRL